MSVEGRANLGPDDGSAQRRPTRSGRRHRDRIPSPHEVERDLNQIAGLIPALKKAYRWAYPASLSASKGEGVKVQADRPDPTGDVAAGKEPTRRRVATAAKKIADMRTDAIAALALLEDAMGEDPGHEPDPHWRPKLAPKELKPLEEAQQRREERNEGYGEG